MKKGRTTLCWKRVFGRFKKLTLGNGMGTIGNRRRDQRQVGGGGEVTLIIKKLKSPQPCGSPGVFFAREDESSSQGEVQKKESGVDRSISEGVLTTIFGARGGGSLKKTILKPPQRGGSPGDFSSVKTRTCIRRGPKRRKREGTRAYQRGSKEQVWGR